MPLDRCTNQRKNKRWLTAEFNHENTLFCIINDGMSLFNKTDNTKPIYLSKQQLISVSRDSCIFLGKGLIRNEVIEKNKADKLPEPNAVFAIDYDIPITIQSAGFNT